MSTCAAHTQRGQQWLPSAATNNHSTGRNGAESNSSGDAWGALLAAAGTCHAGSSVKGAGVAQQQIVLPPAAAAAGKPVGLPEALLHEAAAAAGLPARWQQPAAPIRVQPRMVKAGHARVPLRDAGICKASHGQAQLSQRQHITAALMAACLAQAAGSQQQPQQQFAGSPQEPRWQQAAQAPRPSRHIPAASSASDDAGGVHVRTPTSLEGQTFDSPTLRMCAQPSAHMPHKTKTAADGHVHASMSATWLALSALLLPAPAGSSRLEPCRPAAPPSPQNSKATRFPADLLARGLTLALLGLPAEEVCHLDSARVFLAQF